MKPAEKFWRYCVLIAGAAFFAAKAETLWPGSYAAISTANAADVPAIQGSGVPEQASKAR